MRRLLLLCLMLVLSLRGWAGEAMATGMAVSQLAASAQAAPGEAGLARAMPADCPMAALATDEATNRRDAGASSCSACDLCVPLAALPAGPRLAGDGLPGARPAAHAVRFASATARPGLEPPIS